MNTTIDTMQSSLAGQGLVRSQDRRLLGGVCSGVAQRLDTSVWAVRLLAIVLSTIIHPLPVLYLVAWVVMPQGRAGVPTAPSTPMATGTSYPVGGVGGPVDLSK